MLGVRTPPIITDRGGGAVVSDRIGGAGRVGEGDRGEIRQRVGVNRVDREEFEDAAGPVDSAGCSGASGLYNDPTPRLLVRQARNEDSTPYARAMSALTARLLPSFLR